MDMEEDDYFEQFFADKKKKEGPRENHRWSHPETLKLLKGVIAMMRETGAEYERPTARAFYEELKLKYFTSCRLTCVVIKSKMRHLRSSYTKAIEWKDTVGMELYESDQKFIKSRIKSICPYFNLLDDIFGNNTNADPIGFRLPEDDDTMLSDSINHQPAKRLKDDKTEALLVPKKEAFYDEHMDFRDETFDTNNDEESRQHNARGTEPKTAATKTVKRSNTAQNSNMSLEERKFQLEKQKFQVTYALQSRRLSLEEKRLRFEREKFEKQQKMRKYEIDKQFAIKKKEIESNERLRRLAMGKNHDIVVDEIENITYEPDINDMEEDDDDEGEEEEEQVEENKAHEEEEESEKDEATGEEEKAELV